MKFILVFCVLFMSFCAFAQQKIAQQVITRSAGMVFIKISVNGSKELNFLFDSGAATTVVDAKTAASIGLVTGNGSISVNSSAGTAANYPTFSNPVYALGNARFSAATGLTTDLSGFTKIFGLQVDGIVGQDLLKNYSVELDLDKNCINVYDGQLENWYADNVQKLPFTLKNGTPRITLSLVMNNKSVPGTYLFDTGAAAALSCNAYFNQLNSLQAQVKSPSTTASLDISGQNTESTIGQVDGVTIGKYALKNTAVSISKAEYPLPTADAGLLGMGLIGRFNILFDNKGGTISISPNKTFNDPFVPIYQLGIGLSWNGGAIFSISNLRNDAIAYQSGLRNGDVIEKVNGQIPAVINDLYQDLKKLGTMDLKIEVKRDGKPYTIILKKLIS